MKISFIQPSRNNLKYLKWSYESIRKNQGRHEVEICVADDFSNDGTWDWCLEKMKEDSFFKAIRNEGPSRLGHTILYDKLINEVATNDIAIIYHADMYLCPGALDAIERHIKPKTIVSLTRIEPPLHPSGPEKIIRNFGTEPEDFNEKGLIDDLSNHSLYIKDKTTDGVFAPWAFYRKDFQEIGGHDPIFAPQSKEDSDIFNRFYLNGVTFIQTWEGFVYHMTCRGSRYNPTLTTVGKESDEWLRQNIISSRNFIRKWGHFVKHDRFMKPIVPPKYNIGIILSGGFRLVEHLEPWCSTLYVEDELNIETNKYIAKEQPNTTFDLRQKIKTKSFDDRNNDILIYIDQRTFTENDFQTLQVIPEILKETDDLGTFELGNLKIEITNLKQYQNDLIKV